MTAAARVLVVDDEEPLRRLTSTYLSREGFEVAEAADGLSAIETARAFEPNLMVLDLGLPGVDGYEVCRQVRTFSQCYILMLTARSEEVDILLGLSLGADDYMTKPFSPRELVARIKARLRRTADAPGAGGPLGAQGASAAGQAPAAEATAVLQFGALSIDPEAREVELDGEPVDLTRTEFDLLLTLAERPRRAFTRRQLVESVWGEAYGRDEHLVDPHVVNLRRKLGDDASTGRYVRTVRGVGYRMGDGS